MCFIYALYVLYMIYMIIILLKVKSCHTANSFPTLDSD